MYLAVIKLGSLDLKTAIQQFIADGKIENLVLDEFDELASNVADRTIFILVADAFSKLSLFDVVFVWPYSDQSWANSLRLQAEAGKLTGSCEVQWRLSGIRGMTKEELK